MLKFMSALLVLSLAAIAAEFPESIARCQRGDNACFTQTGQEIVKNFHTGLRDLNLIPFDPLRVNSMALERNPASPVNVELRFKNLDVVGLRTAQVRQIKGLNFNESSLLEAVVPKLLLKGDYTTDGRVIILPITGSGKSLITCKNILLRYVFNLKPVNKNDDTYATVEHGKLEFKPELVQYHFDGLFNGDKALGDNMNKFLNENWREIYNELEGGFATALGLIVKQIINNVLSKYPYDLLFQT